MIPEHKDGPSNTLLEVLHSNGNKAPNYWKGYRELTEKWYLNIWLFNNNIQSSSLQLTNFISMFCNEIISPIWQTLWHDEFNHFNYIF